MDLKEEDENTDNRQLYLVGAARDPLVSTGAIVDGNDDINSSGDLQASALAGLMSGQSTSVCFPTKFSKSTALQHFYYVFFYLINCHR